MKKVGTPCEYGTVYMYNILYKEINYTEWVKENYVSG